MRTLKIMAVLVSLTFLMSSCYTQLALVQRETPQKAYSENNSGAYYYPPSTSDTLYEEGSPQIVQNFYNTPPYYDPYDLSFNIGIYNDWWWDDFYYTSWPFIGFRPLLPVLLYPMPYWAYNPYYYWNYPYYDYGWGWYPGDVYGTTYGPRPFHKGGSLVRGGGSRRVRISHSGSKSIGGGSFLPTRAIGGSTSGKGRSIAIRKRVGEGSLPGSPRGPVRVVKRKDTARQIDQKRTVINRRGRSSRAVISKRSSNIRGRRYFPITTGRSTRRQTIVKQNRPRTEPRIKTRTHRSARYRNAGTYQSHRWSPPSRSTSVSSGRSHPSYSAPSRSTHVRSAPVRSSTPSRSSGSRSRAVRRK